MLDNLGKRRYVMPIVAVIVIFCVMSLVVYPMLNAAPKDIPFAVLSLDEGMETPAGAVNAGDAIVETLTSGTQLAESQESPILWKIFDNQKDLDAALENNEVYGAIVIPADFTSGQAAVKIAETQAAMAQAQAMLAAQAAAAQDAAAQAGAAGLDPAQSAAAGATPAQNPADVSGLAAAPSAALTAPGDTASTVEIPEAPSLMVIINQGKNPMIASTMQSLLITMFYQTGVKAEFSTIHTADVGSGGMGAMGALMSGNMLVMPFVMMTLAASILLFFTTRPKKGASRTEKVKVFGIQLGYGVVLSLLIALADVLIVTWVGSMSLPIGTIIPFLWLASFCMLTLFVGALDIAAPLGVLVILLVFGCGMSSAMLAPEMLPQLWRDWIYPWVPQHYIGNGVTSIIYMNSSAWNAGSLPLALTGGIGLALMLIALLLPSRGIQPDSASQQE